ncbi:hydroxymethylglutaryl-CoA reductase, degradative [Paracoccus alkanivorans]|uniref:3-hydroxy-3-methylglutaryl coenzyme A reductase n=1 Tax=Paracoccus alkanivorans TaxID=2116655 RepID=A0A3M0M1J2_9RHOB|nr:hydroxymethylglutaryl-CoA reductase, degradative [Paracoccus alkanivorans]RMC31638.1 hydroxymethylglutaryl-CoA reductase, degradative [Paracoccus alkanivorans]
MARQSNDEGPQVNSRLNGYRNKTPRERLNLLAGAVGLSSEAAAVLGEAGALDLATANGMIENVVGRFELPLGIATNFTINGRDRLVPMAVEEPSVVAAASYMARIARDNGGFETSSSAPVMRAQVQLLNLSDPYGARLRLLAAREEIVAIANSRDEFLVRLGGGCRDIEVQVFPSSARGPMVVLHLLVDVRDAMGANAVNTMAEAVAPKLEELTGGTVRLRILSNLADQRLARARVRIAESSLRTDEFSGRRMIDGILDAHELAVIDPYRAATHNKGIMNGVDPVIVATGNDWRAIEAGAHAYAARNGRYTSLSTWEIDRDGCLVGTLEMPMAVGLVGGATRTHPAAQVALQILGIQSAQELAEITVAVGLAQNMAALRALASEGIQRGHMTLHARNIAIVAGAVGSEIEIVAGKLAEAHDVRTDRAREILREMRREA